MGTYHVSICIVDGVQPLLQRRQAGGEDTSGEVRGIVVNKMRYECPHGVRASLQFGTERRVVGVRFKLHVLRHLPLVNVHALEHGEKREPHVQQRVVEHEAPRDRSMREHVVQVAYQRPVAVVLHHRLAAVDDEVEVVAGI